jgi:hypothetical protein
MYEGIGWVQSRARGDSFVTSNTDAICVNRAKKAILLIRILVGWVFLSEGMQKFLFPEALGVGRFAKIGIPLPRLMAPFHRSHRDHLRRAPVGWSLYSPCLRAPHHRHLRRLVLDQDRHIHEERVLEQKGRSEGRL